MGRTLACAGLLLAGVSAAGQGLEAGRKLPPVDVPTLGALVPSTVVENGRMALAGKALGYRPWNPKEMLGRVWTLYHLAARMGVARLNQPYLDALAAEGLPEFAIDAPYKTVVILDLQDSWLGLGALGLSALEKRQRQVPYAIHVADQEGLARAAWELPGQTSCVAVVDRNGTVRFFKAGKLSPEEIRKAVGIIKDCLSLP